MRLLTLFASITLLAPVQAAYPRPELLVEPADVAKIDGVILLDARPRTAYDAGHAAGARWLDHAAWATAFQEGQDAPGWSQRLGALGVQPTSQIVIYDDSRSKDAARVWWILRYWGYAHVRLLNGGWTGWQTAQLPTSTTVPEVKPVELKLQPAAERLTTKEQLLAAIPGSKVQIVDARSEAEHCGTDKQTNRRAGAMPGAKHLEWTQLLDAKTQRFKPAADLNKLFADAGIGLTADRPTVAHCQGGGRSAVMAFALELMGAKQVSNYYRSWGEWGNADDTPIVTPAKK
jgi:thiosulfate/3-mercaptopyruvate sulfurtransferase